jgi:hypothetical protein
MTKKALFVLSGAAIPASMQATVLILEPNLTITQVADFIGFNPETGLSSINSYPAGNSFGLSYSGGTDLNKPMVGGQSGGFAEVAYYSTPVGGGSSNMAVNFAPLSDVGPSASWLAAGSSALLYKNGATSGFPAGTRGFVGLRTGDGTDWNYAWADVTYGSDTSLTLHGFGYETEPNLAIQTTQVPEAKTGFAAALAAGSLVAWRARQLHRRNRKGAASEPQAAA